MSTSTGVSAPDRANCDAGNPAPAARATWVYAISLKVGQPDLTGLQGIGGGQIRTLSAGSLTAVVESVDPAAFSAEALHDRLSDPAELEVVARRHHDVVVAVAALGPALPLRLATVYLTDDRVRSLLAERRDEFCQTLTWLARRTECGIKAWADPDTLNRDRASAQPSSRSPDARPAQPEPADQSGAAYLLRRRAQLAARAEGQRLAARCGEEIHAALVPLAVASRLHPLHDTREAADAGLQVLNAAYLVESASLPEFAESARTVAAQSGAVSVVVTGPWPAYSFADGPSA
jgi:hypothetical protein